MKILNCLAILALIATQTAHAITVSSMLEIADGEGKAEIAVTNTESYRQYLNIAVSEITVKDGEIIETPYTRDNIENWSIEVRPTRSIIDAGFKKTITAKFIGDRETLTQDRTFKITIIPSPYFKPGEEPENVMKLVFGFAPVIIIPAENSTPEIDYQLSYKGDKVYIENKGDSFFTAYLNTCKNGFESQETKDCSTRVNVLAGRKMAINLSGLMKTRPTLHVKLKSYGNRSEVLGTYKNEG